MPSSQLQSALPAVIIALPSASTFYAATMMNVETRIGNSLPNDTAPASEINSLCTRTTSRLGERGRIVRLECASGILVGRVVTIQIR